jgi:hypothetical protein
MPKKKLRRSTDLEIDEFGQPVEEEQEGRELKSTDLRRRQLEAGEPATPDSADENIALDGDHTYSLDAATDTEYPSLSESAEVVMDEIERYTNDEDVQEDFAERQKLNTGREQFYDQMRQHHSKTPDLSGGDVDAAWQDSDVSGEESVGGTAPTPDQDRVDDLGDAFGLNYDDDEPLDTVTKIQRRDRNRLDMSPSSMIDVEADEEELDDLLEETLGEDLDKGLDDELAEELEEDLEDEYPDEIEDELDYDIDDEEEDFDDELDEYLDEEFDDEDDEDDEDEDDDDYD